VTNWIVSNLRAQTFEVSREQNNNKMERFNAEIRMIERPKRGVKKADSPILMGYQIYHNCIRAHKALDRRTPADECGIKIEGKDKWLTLIQNASKPD
jgi:transposase-like protein